MKIGKWALEVEDNHVYLKEKGWLKASALPNKEGEGYVVTTGLEDGDTIRRVDTTSRSPLIALLARLKLDFVTQEDLYTVISLLSSALAQYHNLKVGSRISLPADSITPIEITFTKGDKAFVLVIYIDTKKRENAGFETAVSYIIGPDGVATDHTQRDSILDKLNELVEE